MCRGGEVFVVEGVRACVACGVGVVVRFGVRLVRALLGVPGVWSIQNW